MRHNTVLKTLIIIPLYNEEENIDFILNDLKENSNFCDLLFIDDNSTDNTYGKLLGLTNFPVLHLSVNLGIGGTVQLGFKYAKEKNYDIAVQYDGDGQHVAAEITKLLKPIFEDKADVVVGSRFLSGNSEYKGLKTRKIGIIFFQLLNSILIGKRITDSTSGFRAYNLKAISFLSDNYPSDYPEPEAIILFHKNNLRFLEVPVEMRLRLKGKSSILGILSFYYMLKVTISIFFSNLQKIKN
jgi:glycosyltransferase involved in cell wall biosynthesis